MAAAFSYCLEGRVEGPSGVAPPAVNISEVLALSNGTKFTPATAKPAADGRFRACGFAPGDYRVSATTLAPRTGALTQVSVLDKDARDIALSLRPAPAVVGDTVWDPPPRHLPEDFRLQIGFARRFSEENADQPKSVSTVSGGLWSGERVLVPGPFRLTGLSDSDQRLNLGRLPEGCYIKEATLGTADIRHGAIDLINAAGRLHIVLACDGATLTAHVTDHDGNPVSQAHLYLMPAAAESDAAMSVGIQEAEVEKGWGALKGPIPPGKYLAIACSLSTDGTAEPLIRLWRARSSAKEVEIGANGTVQVNLEPVEVN